MERLVVKERRDLERDTNSKAILSTDGQSYRKRLKQKKILGERKKEIDYLKNKVDNLTNLVETLIKKIDK